METKKEVKTENLLDIINFRIQKIIGDSEEYTNEVEFLTMNCFIQLDDDECVVIGKKNGIPFTITKEDIMDNLYDDEIEELNEIIYY